MTAPTDPLSLGDGFDNKGLAPAAASLRHRAASPSGLSRQEPSSRSGITWRILSKLRDFLFEAPTDALGRINLWCSAIALVALVAVWAFYLETFL